MLFSLYKEVTKARGRLRLSAFDQSSLGKYLRSSEKQCFRLVLNILGLPEAD